MELVKADNMAAQLQGLTNLPVLRQLGVMIGLAASVALGVAVVLWSQQPTYGMLFNNLSNQDSSAIVEQLQHDGIKYKLDPTSGAVMVPASKVYAVRLKLAGAGLPKSAGAMDMFDKQQSFGTSQFVENIRYQQALQQELARSVASIDAVKSARIHLALPKQSAFLNDKQKPSASVVVELYPGRSLNRGQVAAIQQLVAASIANLDANNVTVVDQTGDLLSGRKGDSALAADDQQFDYTRRIEHSYAKRIENIISPIVGLNGVRAQVTADLDFSSVDQTQQTYNPDTPALRSEQTYEQKTTSAGAQGVPGALSNTPPAGGSAPEKATGQGTKSSSSSSSSPVHSTKKTTVNYELDQTISHTRLAPGRIKHLSVAVVVNDKQVVGKNGKVTVQPRSAQEMAHITSLVKEAVGYNAARGDSVNVINASFTPETVAPLPQPPVWKQPWVWDIAKQVLAGVFVLLLVFGVLRPMLRNLTTAAKSGGRAGGDAEGEGERDLDEDQLTLGGPQHGGPAQLPNPQDGYDDHLALAKQMAVQDPKHVAQVVKTWISSDD